MRRLGLRSEMLSMATTLACLAASLATGGAEGPGRCHCNGTVARTAERFSCSNTSVLQADEGCVLDNVVDVQCEKDKPWCFCKCKFEGDLVLTDHAEILCSEEMGHHQHCGIELDVQGSVTMLRGASVAVSSILLRSTGSFTQETGAALNTTGLGLAVRSPARQGFLEFGGSNGGRGGQSSCTVAPDLDSPQIGDPALPWAGWAVPFIEDKGGRIHFLTEQQALEAGAVERSIDYGNFTLGMGFGGSSTKFVSRNAGRGGGRIFIQSNGTVSLSGAIVADGAPPSPTCAGGCGSGAGGTIVIYADKLVGLGGDTAHPRLEQSAISAIGGHTMRNMSGAGGGGRIAIFASSSIDLVGTFDLRAYGGAYKGADLVDLTNCLGGAAGTVLRGVLSPDATEYAASVQISNCPIYIPCSAATFASASTAFSYPRLNGTSPISPKLVPVNLPKVHISFLQVDKYASVNSSVLILDHKSTNAQSSNKNATVPHGLFVKKGRVMYVKRLEAWALQLSTASTVSTNGGAEIVARGGEFTIDDSSSISFVGELAVKVVSYAHIAGSISAAVQSIVLGSPSMLGSPVLSHLHVYARQFALTESGVIKADRVTVLSSNTVDVLGKITGTKAPSCVYEEERPVCGEIREFGKQHALDDMSSWFGPQNPLTNFSLAIVIVGQTPEFEVRNPLQAFPIAAKNVSIFDDLEVHPGAELTGRNIALCANLIGIRGSVKGSGQGCLSDSGVGAGCTSSSSAGGGGSHGGVGGTGIGCSLRGKTYDDMFRPTLSGSGGGSGMFGVGAGAGGGSIHIGAAASLLLEGSVQADGANGDGQNSAEGSAGGGGAGGSVYIVSPVICSRQPKSSVISATGGDGGPGGGGGGGGGRIAIEFDNIMYLSPSPLFGAHSNLGQSSTSNGFSLKKSSLHTISGFAHRIVAGPNPKIENANLVPPLGSVSKFSCTNYGNFSSAMSAAGGDQGIIYHGHILGSVEVNREGRVRNGSNGTIATPRCGYGYGGVWCNYCALGTYKDWQGPEECKPCPYRKCINRKSCYWLAEGATTSDCPVLCSPGHVLPNCVTPLENLIESMGGVVAFAVVIAIALLTLVIIFTCVCTKVEWCPGYVANEARMRRKRIRTANALQEHRRQLGFASSTDQHNTSLQASLLSTDHANAVSDMDTFGPTTVPSPATSSIARDGDEHHYIGMSESPEMGKRRSKNGIDRHTDFLCESDVPYHLSRIYFAGENTTSDPWQLPETLSDTLRSAGILDEAEYLNMARKVNRLAQYSNVTVFISFTLHILCYPLGHMYMQRQRQVRAYVLRAFFETYDHACVCNTRARALMNTFKFGKDADANLGYVDVLAAKPIDPLSRESRLPLLLFLAGNGSYWSPYRVDWQDTLLRAVPQLVELTSFIDQTWADMVNLHLNAALRPFSRSIPIRTSEAALRVLERYKSERGDLLGGLEVRLGMFKVPGFEDSNLAVRPAIVLCRDARHSGALCESGASSESWHDGTSPKLLKRLESESEILTRQSSILLANTPTLPRTLMEGALSEDLKRVGIAAVHAFEQEERVRNLGGFSSSNGIGRQSTTNLSGDRRLSSEPGGLSSAKLSTPTIRDKALSVTGSTPEPRTIASNAASKVSTMLDEEEDGLSVSDLSMSQSQDGEDSDSSSLDPDSPNIMVPATDALESSPYSGRVLHRRIRSRQMDQNLRDLFDDSSSSDEEEEAQDGAHHTRWAVLQWHLCDRLGILLNRMPSRRDSKLCLRGLLSLCVAVDATIVFLLLTTFYCVNHVGQACLRTLFIVELSVYPLAVLVSPLLGLTLVIFPLSGIGRHYAVWTLLSMINAFAAIVMSFVYRERFSFEAGLLSIMLLIIKMVQARAVDRYIAILEMDLGRRKAD